MVNRRKKKSQQDKSSPPNEKCVRKSSVSRQKEGEDRGAAGAKGSGGQASPSDLPSTTSTKEEPKKDPAGQMPLGAAGQTLAQPPQPTRFSARVAQKRPRQDASPPRPGPSPPAKKPAGKKTTPDVKKRRRQWECWTMFDKNIFFNALCEHGKDFDAIHHVLLLKHKKMGDAAVVKTKDQIRHFYYRTWHKICKHLKDIEHVKNKQAAELFGLINFGEIRKKLGPILNEKSAERFNELVHTGVTNFKVKGKNQRLRTPVCRALKKLTFAEEKEVEKLTVPDSLVVELRPRTSAAWARVQSVSQNPRLRVNVKSGKRLSSLLAFLNKKWATPSAQLLEQLKIEADHPETSQLRLYPPPGVTLTTVTVQPPEPQQPTNLSLEVFLKITKNVEPVLPSKKSKESSGTGKKGKAKSTSTTVEKTVATDSLTSVDSKSSTHDTLSKDGPKDRKLEPEDLKPEPGDPPVLLSFKGAISNSQVATATPKLSTESAEDTTQDSNKESTKDSTKDSKDSSAVAGTTQNKDKTFAKDNPPSKAAKDCTESKELKDNPVINPPAKASAPKDSVSLEDLDEYRKGWTLNNANVSLAEVYLLFNAPEKFILEYEWTEVDPQYNFLKDKLTNVMRRLVQIASTEYLEVSKNKNSNNASAPTCSQCGKGLGRSPRVRGGSPSTPRTRGRSRANSDSGSSTPKSRNSASAKQKAGPSEEQQHKEPKEPEEPALPAVTVIPEVPPPMKNPDEGVFRVPQTPTKVAAPHNHPPKSSMATMLENQQLLQQINSVQRQANANFMLPPRPRARRPCRRPLIVQRRLLPRANMPSRQLVAFTMGQNSMSIEPMGELGSFSQLPPPGGTVQNSDGTVTATAGQCVVARQLIPDPPASLVYSPKRQPAGPSVPAVLVSHAATTYAPAEPVPTSATQSFESQMQTIHDSGSAKTFTSLEPVPIQAQNNTTSITTTSLTESALQPPSISSLLDISLPPVDVVQDGAAEKLIDIALENTTASFTGFLDNSKDDMAPLPSGLTPRKVPVTSNSNSMAAEAGWFNGEDLSLTSFLLDTPAKKPATEVQPVSVSGFACESSRDSIASRFDVDSAFQSLMNENSLDYVAKFADLAAQISANAQDPENSTR